MTEAGSVAKRAGWGVADQALSSLTNFAASVAVARTLGVVEFGAFSLAFAAYLVAVNVVRAIAADPMTIRFSMRERSVWARATADATGATVAISVPLALLCVLVSLTEHGALSQAFLALALTLPGLLLQDTWRQCFFAAGRGRAAVVNDGAWALLLLPLYVTLELRGNVSVFTAVSAWGVTATVAAALGVIQSRVVPRPWRLRAWWREHRDIVPPMLGEFVALNGARQLSLFAISGLVGLAAAGAYRAGEVLLGPMSVLFQGGNLFAAPEAARLYRERPDRLPLVCRLFGLALAAAALAVGVVVLLIPDALGRAVLGATWPSARSVVLPVALVMSAAGATAGAFVGLRVLAAAARSFRTRAVTSVLIVAATVIGALAGGLQGAAWGIAAATWVGVLAWWHQFSIAFAEARGSAGGTSAAAAGPATRGRLVTVRAWSSGVLLAPPAPRAAAMSSLLLLPPFSTRARTLWTCMRAGAGAGALRLLPAAELPALQGMELLAPHLPADGYIAVRAMTQRSRWNALVMNSQGRPYLIAKVATSPVGQEKLTREWRAYARFAPLLVEPLRSPRLHFGAPGILVFESVPWRPRRRPWYLPPDIAAALGALTRAEVTHGDMAPWNLLSAEGRWYVTDWEDARTPGEPFEDLWHFLVQSHVLLGRPALRELFEGPGGAGWVGRTIAAYAEAVGLSAAESAPALVDYMRRHADVDDDGLEAPQRRRRDRLVEALRDGEHSPSGRSTAP